MEIMTGFWVGVSIIPTMYVSVKTLVWLLI